MRPFFSIWIHPLETFKYLSARDVDDTKDNCDFLFAILALSVGLPGFVDFANLFDSLQIFGFVIAALVIVSLGVVNLKFIQSIIIWLIGKILQGKATVYEIRLVIAYSLIPNIIHLLIGLILVIPAVLSDNITLILYQHPITLVVVWIFTVRNLIFGLAYFNKFSYGYAVLNLIIPIGIVEAVYLTLK